MKTETLRCMAAAASVAINLALRCAAQDIEIRAEAFQVSAPFAVTNGYVCQEVETDLTNAGRAACSFVITNAGTYALLAKLETPSTNGGSFFINIDSEPIEPTMIWDIPGALGVAERHVSWRGTGTAASNEFVPKTFTLSQGSHELILRGRTGAVRLKSLLLRSSEPARPAPPTGLRIVGS